MATADSITTNSKVISGCFGMPRISMPKDVEEITENSRHRLYFEIETHKGAIKASSYSGTYWTCLGTADALEAVGLLRPEWCPGLPGNGKTRQAVVFDADGARLVFNATYRNTKGLSYIVIHGHQEINSMLNCKPQKSSKSGLLRPLKDALNETPQSNRKKNKSRSEKPRKMNTKNSITPPLFSKMMQPNF